MESGKTSVKLEERSVEPGETSVELEERSVDFGKTSTNLEERKRRNEETEKVEFVPAVFPLILPRLF